MALGQIFSMVFNKWQSINTLCFLLKNTSFIHPALAQSLKKP